MDDSENTSGIDKGFGSSPLFGDSPRKRVLLRIYAALVAFLVFLALIFSLVKAKDEPVKYLLVVNLLISSVVGGTIAWWYHKEHITSDKVAFIIFVGVCLMFQAISADVYVYHQKPIIVVPTRPPPINGSFFD